MKQSCNKKEKNRTNIYLKKGKNQKIKIKTEKHFNNYKKNLNT